MRKVAIVAALTTLSLLTVAAGAGPAFASASGVFSVKCSRSDLATQDPIVFPGKLGMSHLHQFFGNRSTNAASTYRSLTSSPRTSCLLSADTSAYWSPALLDAKGNPVAVKNFLVYYRGDSSVVAPPADLRLIAGATVGTPTGTDKLGWNCSSDRPYQASFAGIDCGKEWLKAHIVFPSCWDGDLTGTDDTSHLSYAPCGKAYPYRIPQISVHITYAIHAAGAGFALASDDMLRTSGGRSLHADFWNTWQQSALETLVRKCLNTGADCKQITNAQLKAL